MLKRGFMLAFMAQFLALCGAGMAQTTSSPSPGVVTRAYTFLPVGVAPGETMQVNVVNTGQTPAATPAATPSCTGTISFINASGTVIGTPAKFTVGLGQIFSASLSYGQAGVTGNARAEIRAQIQLMTPAVTGTGTPTVMTPVPACSLSYSLETFDTATGVTHINVPGQSSLNQIVPLLGVER
jgi:hypothetical protein